MTEIFSLAALWLGLALLATLLSIWLRIATAISEIVIGTVAQAHYRRAAGCRGARNRPVLDKISFNHGRSVDDFPRRRRTRSGRNA